MNDTNSTAAAKPDFAERSPFEYPDGLFIADVPGMGGAAGFYWFWDEAQALDYLRHDLLQPYGLEPGELASASEAIADMLNGLKAQRLKSINLVTLNRMLEGLCEVRWAGSFDDLRSGNDTFEREVQADYRENIFGDERGFAETDSDDFAHHLTHYCSWA